jgi:hypothetical protein
VLGTLSARFEAKAERFAIARALDVGASLIVVNGVELKPYVCTMRLLGPSAATLPDEEDLEPVRATAHAGPRVLQSGRACAPAPRRGWRTASRAPSVSITSSSRPGGVNRGPGAARRRAGLGPGHRPVRNRLHPWFGLRWPQVPKRVKLTA